MKKIIKLVLLIVQALLLLIIDLDYVVSLDKFFNKFKEIELLKLE